MRRSLVSSRRGQIHFAWVAFLASVALLVALVAVLAFNPQLPTTDQAEQKELVVYCAAGLKQPIEAVAKEYEKEYGVPIRLQYGGSNTLLSNIELTKQGDLFVPADESYVAMAREKHLVNESIPLAEMRPVLAVKKGNPKQVKGIGDLINNTEVALSQAKPDAAAVGKLVRAALEDSQQWEAVKARTKVEKGTVNDVANDIKLGAVDAGFVWDATVRQYPELEAVAAPELDGKVAHVQVAVLTSSKQPTAALRFARYLAASDKGMVAIDKAGFKTVEGDKWSDKPELQLFAGSMLRPAIEATITDFENREGVKVTRVYNGCGILVGNMKTGAVPDAYFACDSTFMKQVSDLFLESSDVSKNRLVIVVQKGNPLGIYSLQDLGSKKLKLGIGHEQQCAMGALTETTLIESGTKKQVLENVVVRVPAGDMLINQMRTGALDAAIAYVSNAAMSADELDAISIEGLPCAIATQPIAVSKNSPHKQLAARLRAAIESATSQERFLDAGFTWLGGKKEDAAK